MHKIIYVSFSTALSSVVTAMETNARADGIQPTAEVKFLNDRLRAEQLRQWREWVAKDP